MSLIQHIANPAGLISIVLCQESFMPQPVAVYIWRRNHQQASNGAVSRSAKTRQ
ncbi:MAG: hypothetical protein JGK17_18005 [Microcoleus sp. PH2017_10_PVI_O_A]|uniref:hypothetical protein n=1 Tax=unclassified Microcoleus TaxID=2642155 RepID=UPI001D4F7512|nr:MULTISPECIES: hypothetical protein [unclassified Microcoleus]MCC3407447.1 hypothetical protein [Microcoleus sp. PH2017_10_PVI_O_A]MCC3463266.1 hypothetical protein [Microcoleus sp. PH2017_11_PCY_U_A]MCC3480002.1 hypothetical protein [Microcoleus sp. PH2017_12_PCY_D_A]MCC3529808.1 hypothetical protein [Microcoleus sp. PH2017_21_RUC_O_A]MCC3542018.1 hypothetical protein [Microcoleus sp. PH2017_22_RUC_O_B]